MTDDATILRFAEQAARLEALMQEIGDLETVESLLGQALARCLAQRVAYGQGDVKGVVKDHAEHMKKGVRAALMLGERLGIGPKARGGTQ
jgi:hypothetical protein